MLEADGATEGLDGASGDLQGAVDESAGREEDNREEGGGDESEHAGKMAVFASGVNLAEPVSLDGSVAERSLQ